MVEETEDREFHIPLFESGHEGYGDSILATKPHKYHRVLRGFDLRTPGKMKFGDFITRIAHGVTIQQAPVWAGEWISATSAGIPVIYYLSGKKVMKLQGGVSSEVGTNALAQVATGAAFHGDDTGIAYLYIAEGFAGNMQKMNLATTVSTGNVVRDKLASISGQLYGSGIPSGSSVFSAISFVPVGSDPNASASWSTLVVVGWATTDINDIKQVRGIPVVLKPEGIYIYNRQLDLWENKTPAWEAMPHPDNGRGAFSLGLALIIPMGRGGAVIFDGYVVRDFSPFNRDTSPNLDTTQQLFSVIGATPIGLLGVSSVARLEAGGQGSKHAHDISLGGNMNTKLTRRGGSDDLGADVEGNRFFKTIDVGSSFTDYTTEVNDGKWTTYADLSNLDTFANGDWFLVGHPRPFQGVQFYSITTQVNSATLTAEIWTGSSWDAIAITDFTNEAGTPLTGAGMVLMTADPVEAGWATTTVTGDDQALYLVRFLVSAALDAEVQIAATSLLPWRPAIDTTNFPEDALDRAGCYPHILAGELDAQGGGRWHDLGAVMTAITSVDEVSVLLTAEAGGTYGNSTNKTVAIGKQAIFLLEGGMNDTWPFISPKGLAEFPFILPARGYPVKLKKVHMVGEHFDKVTNVWFYWRYGTEDRWSRKSLGKRPTADITINETGAGTEFQWAIGYSMSEDTAARRPAILGIDATFEIVDQQVPSDRNVRTPAIG